MTKLVVFDFDGVFTDGKVIFDNYGNIIKSYNVKDGMGINLLKKNNIKVGVISSYKENNSQKKILEHLNFDYVSINTKNKLKVLKDWCKQLNIYLEKDVAYMGDDLNDIEIINSVNISGCPKDAIKEVLNISYFISEKKGGEGCVRDFCEYIINNNSKKNIINEIKNEFSYQIDKFKFDEINNLANTIKNIKGNIYFCGVGKSGNIAKHCCDLLKCISFPSFYFDILNSTHGDIGTLTKNDLIIMFSNSGNTAELINIIPLFKNIGIYICGICCNNNSKFKEVCDINIITPFRKELSGTIDKIPTNSYMSHLIFSNILVSILKEEITLDAYKENHLSGNIGKNLLKIKDLLVREYPKIILKEKIRLIDIILKMNKFKIGCCFFVNEENRLLGILTDGDIRRILEDSSDINICLNDKINKDYYFETNLEKFKTNINVKFNYIPILSDNKIIGIISNI